MQTTQLTKITFINFGNALSKNKIASLKRLKTKKWLLGKRSLQRFKQWFSSFVCKCYFQQNGVPWNKVTELPILWRNFDIIYCKVIYCIREVRELTLWRHCYISFQLLVSSIEQWHFKQCLILQITLRNKTVSS